MFIAKCQTNLLLEYIGEIFLEINCRMCWIGSHLQALDEICCTTVLSCAEHYILNNNNLIKQAWNNSIISLMHVRSSTCRELTEESIDSFDQITKRN